MGTAAITLDRISKQYRTGFWGKRFVALEELSLEVRQGEILGYLGPNGAGKTTTFKVLLDLIRPDSGQVSIFGGPAGDIRPWPANSAGDEAWLRRKILIGANVDNCRRLGHADQAHELVYGNRV